MECFLGPLDHEFEFGLAYTNKQGGVPTTINFGRQSLSTCVYQHIICEFTRREIAGMRQKKVP